jgi:hypothetical protein
MCSKGCYLYDIQDDKNLSNCPVCFATRSKATTKVQKFRRITEKIAELIVNDDIREALLYRHTNYAPNSIAVNRESNDPEKEYNDIFDGELYKTQCRLGMFNNPLDIALKIDIDGFTSKYSNIHMTMIHVVVLNFDLSEVMYLLHDRNKYCLFYLPRNL